jgi:hypothetical protein
MKITVVKDWRGQEEIHKAGCADLKRRNRPYRLSEALTMDVENLGDLYAVYWDCIADEAVAAGDYKDLEHAWWAWTGEFDVKPCAANVPEMPEPGSVAAPKPSRNEAKADLARRMILAVSEVLRTSDEADLFLGAMTREEAAQMASNWMAHLPAGRDGDKPWWPASLPEPTAKRWG